MLKKMMIRIQLAGLVLSSRFAALAPNFSPVGALGFYQPGVISFIVSILVHDLIRGGFYHGFWLTYLGFGAYYLLGYLAKDSWKKKALLLPVASLTFFLISNFGVWLYWYPHSFSSLITCYLVAIPFYRNTLLSDLIFGYSALVLTQAIPGIMRACQTQNSSCLNLDKNT